MSSQPCEGCVDWVPVSGTGSLTSAKVCDYIGHTGHARILICPPGEKCTVKSTVPREKTTEQYDSGGYVIRRAGAKERIDVSAVRRMAGQGISDPKIAKALGFSVCTVFNCRKRYNIASGVRRLGCE